MDPVHRCSEGFPWGAFWACGSGGLEQSLPASQGVIWVFSWCVGLGCHEDPVSPVVYPPLGVCFEDVDGGSLRGCIEGVPRWNGYFHSEGVEVWGGRAVEELINVEGRDLVFRVLQWWGHCSGGSGVL